MAHEIDFTRRAEGGMFSVRESPWHRHGVVLDAPPTIEQGLVLAGLDFSVQKLPTYVKLPGKDVQTRMSFATFRMDTWEELGSVGADYTVLQNKDAFRVFQPLLDTGLATLETAGSLRNGRDVWALIRFNIDKFGPVVREVFADEVIPFGLIRNNHAGLRSVGIGITPIRVVCANTLGMADARADAGADVSISVTHKGDVEARAVEAAQRVFGALIERYEVCAKQYRQLKGFYLDTAMFRELVLDVAAPLPQDNPRFTPEARMADAVVARAERRRDAIEAAWTGGRGHTGDHSAWEAYNGLVQLIDHDEDLFPTRSGVYRTQALLDGTLGATKRSVLTSLVKASEK